MAHLHRVVTVLLVLATACGGGGVDTSSEPGEQSSADVSATQGDPVATGSGNQIFTVSGAGINIVDLEAESQESFLTGYEQPYGLSIAGSELWFADAAANLVAVDAQTGQVNGTVQLPGQLAEMVITDDVAWIIAGFVGSDAHLVAIDRDAMTVRGTAVAPPPSYYGHVAALGNDVWVHGGDLESSTTIRRIDPVTLAAGDPVDTGLIVDSMLVGAGALWVGGTKPQQPNSTTGPMSAIAKLDQVTGEVLEFVEIGGSGDGEVVLEIAFGQLWATQGLEAVLIKFDPTTSAERARVDVGGGAAGIPYPILVSADQIWVVNRTDRVAIGFDPDTLERGESGINLPSFGGPFVFVP